MLKYKPGDKVTIRSDLRLNKRYHMLSNSYAATVNSSMKMLVGKERIIESIARGTHYFLEGSTYHWTDEMFCSTPQDAFFNEASAWKEGNNG